MLEFEREDVIVFAQRTLEQVHIDPARPHDREAVNRAVRIEQLHPVGDAKTLAIADDRDARSAPEILLQEFAAPGSDDLEIDFGEERQGRRLLKHVAPK